MFTVSIQYNVDNIQPLIGRGGRESGDYGLSLTQCAIADKNLFIKVFKAILHAALGKGTI